MTDDEKTIALALPGEWALQKTLGPVLAEIGDDLKRLYSKGRDKIIDKAYKKIEDPNDGKSANLRVAHEALTSGAFTDEDICAEYFGGILASSRTIDGKNDDSIQLLDTIKSLSARQLHLHYALYSSINRLLVASSEPINVGQGREIQAMKAWFSSVELLGLGLKIDTDFNILLRQGLIESYEVGQHQLDLSRVLPFSSASPTTYGVLLYAVAHNKYDRWREFSVELFPEFDGIRLPAYSSLSIEGLMDVAGVPRAES
ncbi:hypothetical protein [Cyanobium gracile]|uniref:Uncharacterized protein n=1 Tax=Cyanobium gracile (strain ATCC 27147 / PCC 6307) TaxID=292564 RepID=K9P875_CYAGP|nr:hypothetical protein [Cyanobium gracile]AFY29310.1 hypothetical protein Cyagr_2197 [Cyanobium gracile PCC 6307]